MLERLRTLAYLAASLLFVLSLRGLSTQESARRGNLYGTIGMALAVAVTAVAMVVGGGAASVAGAAGGGASDSLTGLGMLGGAVVVGGVIGALLAARVAMTSMPELVAVLHSFVGAAAVLVGIATAMAAHAHGGAGAAAAGAVGAAGEVVGAGTGTGTGTGGVDHVHLAEIFIGVLVGAVTFTGSVVAFLKLRGTLGSRPLLLPGRHALNLAVLAASGVLFAMFLGLVGGTPPAALWPLLAMTALASLLGVHLVMAIGGGDMPVVVSLLNSYSGWAAAAAGFMLSNDLLIITGALVGSSGAILSYIMCRAMNRSIWNVIFGGFGAEAGAAPGGAAAGQPAGKVQETSVPQTAELLLAARSVIIVPGYGMAVAQAQHAVREITSLLTDKGIKARYAIHPVAGRLPGHMNVLLAEAGVPYDIVHEMEEINEDFHETDVVMVIGANDIVNPSALDDPKSPIYGMPVLEAWKAARVVMLKRGMAAGYAGIDNPLCYKENTLMLFGDAKQSVNKLLGALRGS